MACSASPRPVSDRTASDLKSQIAALKKDGATSLIVDLRGTAEGSPELGIAPARLFVADGIIVSRESRSGPKQDVTAASGDGAIAMPVTLLVTNGTSQAAEVFAAGGTSIHEKGITPDLEVAEPDVDFGEKAPDTDPILDKALERVAGAVKAAA